MSTGGCEGVGSVLGGEVGEWVFFKVAGSTVGTGASGEDSAGSARRFSAGAVG